MRWMAGLAAIAAIALAGCGSSSKSSSGGSSSGGAASTLAVAADPSGALKFTTTSLTAKAGTVTVKFTNASPVPHAVTIQGNGVDKSTAVVSGKDASMTVDLKAGTYTFFCPVDSHRSQGMEGKLVVS
jgi:plastocyanin